MIDWRVLLEWTKKKYAYILAAAVILGFAWLCFFRLDIIWPVKPLFSGHNPFSHLGWPEGGGLLRLLYYPAVFLFICSMITLTPQRKTWFSEFGQRTMQVYFLQYSVIHGLNVSGFFEYIMNHTSRAVWYFSYIPVSLAITVFFSLAIWGKLIRK
jgi:fucose 4-O-acetylase-like acetyltransferase